MSHLSVDRLGALADEEPTPTEAAHIASCAECTREIAAHRAVLAMAALERDYAGAPLTSWEALAPRLREEGLLGRGVRRFSFPSQRQWLEAAAAVLLIGGGAILGRYSAGATPLPPVAVGDNSTPVVAASYNAPFASPAEAMAALTRAQQDYQKALAFLATQDTTGASQIDSSSMYRNRLAALDAVASTTREAIDEAPYDPIINGYYLTTMQAREATLRQLKTTLAPGVKLTRF